MLFHAFRVVYTVKELDSHAKLGQSFKKLFGCITVFLGQKSNFTFFSIVALADANDSGTPYMGISSGRTRLCTHRLEQSGPSTLSFSYTATRNSLEKNVSKEVCLWL